MPTTIEDAVSGDIDSDEKTRSKYRSKREVTTIYLEDLQRKIMAEFQNRTYRTSPLLLKHLAEDYTVANTPDYDNPFVSSTNRQEFFESIDLLWRNDPERDFFIDNVSAMVNRGRTKAEVYFNVSAKFIVHGEAFWRESFCICHWRKRPEDGVWISTKQCTLRGAGLHNAWR